MWFCPIEPTLPQLRRFWTNKEFLLNLNCIKARCALRTCLHLLHLHCIRIRNGPSHLSLSLPSFPPSLFLNTAPVRLFISLISITRDFLLFVPTGFGTIISLLAQPELMQDIDEKRPIPSPFPRQRQKTYYLNANFYSWALCRFLLQLQYQLCSSH